jgi:BMFP domain-containing protein YqiC
MDQDRIEFGKGQGAFLCWPVSEGGLASAAAAVACEDTSRRLDGAPEAAERKVSFTIVGEASLTTLKSETAMQTRNPILDEFAKLTTGAMGLAQAAGEEAKTAWRAQTDRIVAEMDLVRRDEFDVLKDEIAALRAEIAELKAAQKPASKPAAKASGKLGTGTSTDGTQPGDAAG